MTVLPEKMYRLTQRAVVHEAPRPPPVAVRRELRERERTDAERDQAVRDAGGTLQPHRAAGLERALELRGAGGLDPPHRGATARRRQPGHHARNEPPAHGAPPPSGRREAAPRSRARQSPARPRCPDGRTGAPWASPSARRCSSAARCRSSEVRPASTTSPTPLLHARYFHRRRRLGHHDHRADAHELRGVRQRLAVVTARVGDHPALTRGVGAGVGRRCRRPAA